MSHTPTGLIIGKFYPPHRGHGYLIEVACARVESLTVLVCSSSDQSIPASMRVEWLQTLYPEVCFKILEQDQFDRSDSQAWVDATLRLIHTPPDWVFSSEDYGIEYARLLHCQHYMVDRLRTTYPCSGRAIRTNPRENLQFLEPTVATHFARYFSTAPTA